MRARLINEMVISGVKMSDIINKNLIDQWLSDSYLDEMFKYMYAQENELDPEELEDMDLETNKNFEEWFKYKIEELYESTIYKFNYEIINGNVIEIWRDLIVDEKWIDHLKTVGSRLGIYWSWDEDAAEAHWGYGSETKKIPVKIQSEINVNYIDWIETIKLNMNPSGEEEKEIRLFKNTPLKIKSIIVNNKFININQIKNKIFKS